MGNCASVSHLNAELKGYRIILQTDASKAMMCPEKDQIPPSGTLRTAAPVFETKP